MSREYTRDWYLERIAWIKAAKREISMTSDIIVGFPGETEADLEDTATLLEEVGYDAVFCFKYSPRPNTPAVSMADSIPDDEKSRRLQVLLDRQREVQRKSYARHLGQVMEVMVEGHNQGRGQVVGRSSQNKTVNFTTKQPILPALGCYLPVTITQTFPNSLVGEAMVGPMKTGTERGDSTAVAAKGDVEMQIRGLMLDPLTNMPIVILKDVASDIVLPDLGRNLRGERHSLEVWKRSPGHGP